MLSPSSRSRNSVNIWPGFVDMLASALLVFIFMLMIFVVAQFFLADLARSRFGAIDQLSTNIHSLLDELGAEKTRGEEMNAEIEALQRRRDEMRDRIASLVASDEARALRNEELEALVADQRGRLDTTAATLDARDASLEKARELGDEATQQVALLNRQLADLRVLFSRVSSALSDANRNNERYQLEVEDLGQKLNLALAEKVESLSRFRSDFFGRMREVLGERDDIQISGDRFVFQSELLFESGSAALAPGGRTQLDRLAETLNEVAARIPEDVDWILRVDGHTDRRPISTPEFPSNWELSTARALSIVRYFIERGIAPHRLAATGFGAHRPVDEAETPEAFALNRRIEIKFTGP